MKVRFGLIAVLALAPALAQAKPVSHTFRQSCEIVHNVAKSMISVAPYRLISEGSNFIEFSTGSFWKAGKQSLIASFTTEGESCTVTVTASYSGIRRNGTVFLERLEKRLEEHNEDK